MLGRLIFIALLLVGIEGDGPPLHPGQRLEGVERAELVIETAGSYTLGRSDGALVLGDKRSDDGWLVAQLQPGVHVVELPDGPGDVTAFAGSLEPSSSIARIKEASALLDVDELEAARLLLLAYRARPAPAEYQRLARLLQGVAMQRLGVQLEEARALMQAELKTAPAFGLSVVAAAVESLADIALEFGDWQAADRYFETLLVVAQEADDPSLKLTAMSGRARVAAEQGDHEAAARLFEEALSSLAAASEDEEDQRPNSKVTFALLFQAGRWYQDRADFEQAAELFTRAASCAPTWYTQVSALGQLGVVELIRGHYGKALSLMDQAQAVAEPHSPSPHDAALLQNRAVLSYSLGEFGVASRAFERLLPMSTGDEDRAVVLSNQALLALVQGDHQRAIALHDQALAIAPENGRARWLALNGKAATLFDQRLWSRAAPDTMAALAQAQKLDDPFLTTLSLMGASEAHLRLGDPDQARATAEAAVAGLQEQDARDLLLSALCGVANAALAQGDEATVEEILDRAWEEFARTEIVSLPSIEVAQVRSRLSGLSNWGEVAADLAARRVARDPALAATELPRVGRWKSRSLLGERADIPAGPAQLAPLLGERTLVEYAAGDEQLYAFVQHGADVRLVDLGPRRPVEDMLQQYLDGLTDVQALAGPADVARLGGALHARLLAPLELADGGLVIVPSGELARLPFEALVAAAPEDAKRFSQMKFVLDRRDVGYSPSSTALVALAKQPRLADHEGTVLLMGDPTYVAEAAPRLLAARGEVGRNWDRLLMTRDELSRIARLLLTTTGSETARDELFQLVQLEDTRDVLLSTSVFELRLGNQATVGALQQLAPTARLIHIASHAHVDRWDPRRSGLVLAWNETDQGLFGLADIAALDLDADLVVLSACQTADGRLLNGEGVQSLAGAFLTAGARGVVATQWAVQDELARELMETFGAAYLIQGERPDRALRAAKLALRDPRSARGSLTKGSRRDDRLSHPHYWAAFLFSGASTAGGR